MLLDFFYNLIFMFLSRSKILEHDVWQEVTP